MRLVFADPAQQDVADILQYIARDNPLAAERVYQAIAASAVGLVDFPDIGRPGRMPDTRELQIPSVPYMIVYKVDADAVTILAIFHGARDMRRVLAERKKLI